MSRTRTALLLVALVLAAWGCGVEDGPAPPHRTVPAEAAEATADSLERGDAAVAAAPGAAARRDGADGPPPAVDPVVVPDDSPPVDGASADDPVRRPPPPPIEIPEPDERPRFDRPEHVRGIYLNAWTAGSSRRIEALIDLACRTEINSFVIDLKDATGYVSYATGVEDAREIGAAGEIRIRDLPRLLRRLEEEGIYPIARIVIVKDPLLASARPELAVQDTAGGVWVDSKEIRWLNLFDARVWDYHLALAEEAVALGFPEIQWDYVRFADAPRSDIMRAHYPGREGRPRTAAVRAFLERSREELGELDAVVTADVFGVTTSAGDVGIGQVWEDFIDVVDVALPMIYPSHYWRGSFGIERPNAHPYEVVKHALERAVDRSERTEGAGSVRPWLQDFSMGDPDYGAPEVRAQIQATYDAGIEEWLLWNAASRYTAEALRPIGGWDAEPLVRVGGMVVPVSERGEALERARARAADTVPEVPAREVREAAPDTAGGGGGGAG